MIYMKFRPRSGVVHTVSGHTNRTYCGLPAAGDNVELFFKFPSGRRCVYCQNRQRDAYESEKLHKEKR
jgi:hypothetical protein